MDPEKLKAVIAGYSQIGKAFIAATILVFGGSTAVLLYTADKLQLHSVDDVRTKGRDAVQPRADMIKEQIAPLRSWVREILCFSFLPTYLLFYLSLSVLLAFLTLLVLLSHTF
jgi:hypothetical protein